MRQRAVWPQGNVRTAYFSVDGSKILRNPCARLARDPNAFTYYNDFSLYADFFEAPGNVEFSRYLGITIQ